MVVLWISMSLLTLTIFDCSLGTFSALILLSFASFVLI